MLISHEGSIAQQFSRLSAPRRRAISATDENKAVRAADVVCGAALRLETPGKSRATIAHEDRVEIASSSIDRSDES
jgi:hypothetical protein